MYKVIQRCYKKTMDWLKNKFIKDVSICIAVLLISNFAFFKIIPFFLTIVMSFKSDNAAIAQNNYERILSDSLISQYLVNSVVIYIIGAIPEVLFGFYLAALMTYYIKSNQIKSTFTTFFYLPSIISSITITTLFSFMFDAKYGIVNQILQQVNLKPIEVLKGGLVSIFFMAFICFWQWFGYDTFILIVVLNGVSNSVLEQAEMDGAGFHVVLRRIFFPHAVPIIFYLLLTSFISSMQMFDIPYILKNNYSASSITTFGLYIYETAFSRFNFDYASALSVVQFVLIFVISMILIYFYRKIDHKINE